EQVAGLPGGRAPLVQALRGHAAGGEQLPDQVIGLDHGSCWVVDETRLERLVRLRKAEAIALGQRAERRLRSATRPRDELPIRAAAAAVHLEEPIVLRPVALAQHRAPLAGA